MKSFLFLLGGLAACAALGCTPSQTSVQTSFQVKPLGDGTFFGWTEITSGSSIEGHSATLAGVTLSTAPANGDLSFLKELHAAGNVKGDKTELARSSRFPKGEPVVNMEIVYGGDLAKFFPDGHTIRIDWTGEAAMQERTFPADGIEVEVDVLLDLD